MIDHEQRAELSLDLRRLVTGRITNDEFVDLYCDKYCHSKDRAVREIAEFGHDLCGDLHSYRLTGRYALDKATRRKAARCVLFLRSDNDYDWPRWPYPTTILSVASLVASAGMTAGWLITLLLFVPGFTGAFRGVEFVWPVVLIWPAGALSLASFVFGIWYFCLGGHKRMARSSFRWSGWLAHGDYDVWPFRWREDYYHARRTQHLLQAEA